MNRTHDPQARLDYAFDWSAWLRDGETITTATVPPLTGLTIEPPSEVGGVVTVWVQGGVVGRQYALVCHVVTSAGREDDRRWILDCVHR